MPSHENDDNREELFPSEEDEGLSREDPDPRDLAGDDFVRCPHCGKLIFDDSVTCPYCKTNILDPLRPGVNSLWFIITTIVVVVAILLVWSVLGW